MHHVLDGVAVQVAIAGVVHGHVVLALHVVQVLAVVVGNIDLDELVERRAVHPFDERQPGAIVLENGKQFGLHGSPIFGEHQNRVCSPARNATDALLCNCISRTSPIPRMETRWSEDRIIPQKGSSLCSGKAHGAQWAETCMVPCEQQHPGKAGHGEPRF